VARREYHQKNRVLTANWGDTSPCTDLTFALNAAKSYCACAGIFGRAAGSATAARVACAKRDSLRSCSRRLVCLPAATLSGASAVPRHRRCSSSAEQTHHWTTDNRKVPRLQQGSLQRRQHPRKSRSSFAEREPKKARPAHAAFTDPCAAGSTKACRA